MRRKQQVQKPKPPVADDLVSNPVLLSNIQPIVVVKPLLVPVALAAQLLGLGRTMTWELVRLGELCTVRVGSRRLVLMSELEA